MRDHLRRVWEILDRRARTIEQSDGAGGTRLTRLVGSRDEEIFYQELAAALQEEIAAQLLPIRQRLDKIERRLSAIEIDYQARL